MSTRWKQILDIVKPDTVVRWHRKGFRLYWRWISKRGPGRPPITPEVQALIKTFALDNGWGARKIHAELGKHGFTVSLATVSRYMPKHRGDKGKQQRWMTFLRNHRDGNAAMDFFVVPTARFGIVYVFFGLSLDRCRVLHFNATHPPTAEWTALQDVEACPFEPPGRFLVRDNDGIYGTEFRDRVDGLRVEQIRSGFGSPWQNGSAERWIASLRKDCLDHVIAINESQLRRVIRSYVAYYHEDRTHLGLEKDAPDERPTEPREMGRSSRCRGSVGCTIATRGRFRSAA